MNEADLDAEDFLELLWGDEECWVELPAKVNGYWVPYQLDWPPSRDTAVSLRIDQCLRDEEDLYYSVARFREKGRNIEHVLPTEWLWADLDAVHPSTAAKMGLMPTIAVESSPGRYQALWRLTRRLKPRDTEKVNRGLTYALGADRGGWDLTQVLRIPDTRNFKYKGAPRVRMLWYKQENVYDPQAVWATVKEHVPTEELKSATETILPRRDIPHSAQRLLGTKPEPGDDRSKVLFRLNCTLAESGWDEEEIFGAVVNSGWNKFAENGATGGTQLRRDIRRAIEYVHRRARVERAEQAVKAAGGGSPSADGLMDWAQKGRLPVVSVGSLVTMKIDEPEWLVEGIWSARSHGIIGGEPKTGKSTLALALGLAVASGRPFLGEFEVADSGPVLMIQEENTEGLLQDWSRKLIALTGIRTPSKVPMWTMNKAGFDLDYDEHRELLESWVSETKPKLVILDPLNMMFGNADLDKSYTIVRFLKWIVQLGHVYKCAIVLVHHTSKRTKDNTGRRAGQRLLGSTALHGFVDSALYTSRIDAPKENWLGVKIEREFRKTEPMVDLNMAWHFDARGTTTMQIEMTTQNREGMVVEAIRDGGPMTMKQLVEQLGQERKAITRLVDKSPLLKRTHGQGRTIWVEFVGSNGAISN